MIKVVLLKVSTLRFFLQDPNQAFFMDKLKFINCPSLRPILSATGTPTYDLAKFLVPILKPLTENEYTVHDSFSFANDVRKLSSKNLMASLDVESLFTNIPLEETIDNIINDLYLSTEKVHNFEKHELKQLLMFAAFESFFVFDGEYYIQVDGVAMGSPLGPTLANAFLCYYEKKWLRECPEKFLPNVYKRYVDDIFVTFESYSQLLKFVDYMNHQHPNLKFTFEVEQNNSFSFLDVKICRENDRFTTSIYRKPTFSGVFTHFDSFIPTSYKHGLVNTLIFRCFKICSSYEKIHNEIVSLKDILKHNSYPKNFIDNCIKKIFDKLYVSKKVYQTAEKKSLLIVLPFLGRLSFETRNRLSSCIKSQLPFCSLKIAYQSKNRFSNLFKFKESIPKYLRSHLIYKFMCSCCNATYYGETKRHLFVRASEHLGITPLTQKRVKNPKKSAIIDHILLEGHNATYDDFSILTTESNEFKLHLKESLLIKRDKPELNRNCYTHPLELFD